MRHRVVDYLFKRGDIVLSSRRKLHIGDATSRGIARELALNVNLFKRRHLLPNGYMDGVGEIIAVGNIRNHTVTRLEFLHRREAKVLGRRVINAEVQLIFLLEFVATLTEKFLNALGQSHAFGVSMVHTDENLQRFGHAQLPDCQRSVLHSRPYSFLRNVACHGVIVPHKRRRARVLRANPVETLYQSILRFVYFPVKKRHKLLHIAPCFHRECGHNNGRRADIAAPVLQLSEAVDVETVRRAAAHRREICTWIVPVVTGIATPVNVSVVGIKALRRRPHGQLLQVVVRSALAIVHSFHILEDATGEDWRVMVEADTLKTAENKGARYQPSLFEGARSVVD